MSERSWYDLCWHEHHYRLAADDTHADHRCCRTQHWMSTSVTVGSIAAALSGMLLAGIFLNRPYVGHS